MILLSVKDSLLRSIRLLWTKTTAVFMTKWTSELQWLPCAPSWRPKKIKKFQWVTQNRHGHQRWSPRGRPWPRGHILKSLALASKVKSLASSPENWPVLGSRTALFFELLKFCEALENFFGKRFFVEIAWKIFVKPFFFFFWRSLKKFLWRPFFLFFFWRALALVSLASSIPVLGLESLCPWPRAFLSLASRVSVLGKAVLGLGFFLCPWPRALCPRLHLWWTHSLVKSKSNLSSYFL